MVPRLRARSLSATVEFWRDCLGFRLTGSDNPSGEPVEWCELRRDDSTIEFYATADEELPAFQDAVGLCVRPVDVDELIASLGAMVSVAWGPEDFDYGWREAGIRDPNGYLVILAGPLGD